jgi:hypothetical protein
VDVPEVTPREVATAVCAVLGGDPDRLLRPHRGSPRDAWLRWVCFDIYRQPPHAAQPRVYTFTQVGADWQRDRRAVARGLRRLEEQGKPTAAQYRAIAGHLRGRKA